MPARRCEIGREFGQKARRQIVDAVVAGVFERVQGNRFAGAGNAGNQDNAHECRRDSFDYAASAIGSGQRCMPMPPVVIDRSDQLAGKLAVGVLHGEALTIHEVAQRIDAAQLQDRVAHGRFDQHGEVAAGRHLNGDLADRQAEHVDRLAFQRQALKFTVRTAHELNDQLELHFPAYGGFTKDRLDVEQTRGRALRAGSAAAAGSGLRRNPGQGARSLPRRRRRGRDRG